MGTEEIPSIVSVEFEVFGNVQGVYFTKYCRDMSLQLGLGGWVKNSKRGTILGKIQGSKANVEKILHHCNILSGLKVLEDEAKQSEVAKNLWNSLQLCVSDNNVTICNAIASILQLLNDNTIANDRKITPNNRKICKNKERKRTRISWLSQTGSPGCKIERCELRDFEYLARQDFRGFTIRF